MSKSKPTLTICPRYFPKSIVYTFDFGSSEGLYIKCTKRKNRRVERLLVNRRRAYEETFGDYNAVDYYMVYGDNEEVYITEDTFIAKSSEDIKKHLRGTYNRDASMHFNRIDKFFTKCFNYYMNDVAK